MVRRSPKISFALIGIFLILILALLFIWLTNWNPLWIWLVSINLVTFLAYGFDKSQAQKGELRIPEIVLHGLAIIGGFLGGWLGRSTFHHKTRKPIFAVVLTFSTVIWLIVLYIVVVR
jgi:uncharacterized membrane protein YsdA (DUF1294 family)